MNSGLLKTKPDPRDYDYIKTFGVSTSLLPEEYLIEPISIKHQQDTDFCTAAAGCVLAEAQDKIEFSFEWFFSRYGEPGIYGADLRKAIKAGMKGFLPVNKAPFTVNDKERDFLADKNNWPANLNEVASIYGKQGFFNVKGKFDDIKNALWNNRNQRRAILTGIMWYNDWNYNGIIPNNYYSPAGLHAIAIIGFKKIENVDYLIIQNSYGKDIGDNGLFYFNRTVFDKEFSEPMFMYVDLDGSPIQTTGNFFQRLLFKLKNYVRK